MITTVEFEELYRATARDVLAYVRRRTPGDAEELVAETYAVAWQRRADLPPPMLRRAWLFGVARMLLLADSRHRREEKAALAGVALPTREGDHASGSDTAARALGAALERLAPAQRELLRLVAWEGLTPAEVAVALGVRPGTVRVRLHRARQALAKDPELRSVHEEPPDPAVLPVP